MNRAIVLQILFLVFSVVVWGDDKSVFIMQLNNAQWTTSETAYAKYTTLTFSENNNALFGKAQSITILKYTSDVYSTNLLVCDGKDNASKTSILASENNAKFAINCSYFDNSGSQSANYRKTAVPLWYGDAEFNFKNYMEINPGEDELNKNRCSGLIGFKSDGTIGFSAFDSNKMEEENYYDEWKNTYAQFIVSGPLLRLDNSNVVMPKGYNPWFEGENPRSVIGEDAEGYVYMIVIDGRKLDANKSVGTTIEETQKIAEWLELTDAINLDGGGSSNVWESNAGILNWPSNSTSARVERVIPNIIIARQR